MISFLSRTLPGSVTNSLTAAFFKFRAWQTVGINGSHSSTTSQTMSNLKIKVLPALEDNYMYMIVDTKSLEAAIVDPVVTEPVIHTLEEENADLKYILTTHHHWDHAGGNNRLFTKLPGLKVLGGDPRVDALTQQVTDGDTFKLGSLTITCLHTPCHTKGHICYYIKPLEGPGAIFTGDTLFIAGCGKFFEGTADQMYTALIEKLGALPDDTLVYCGHEYTVSNLKFATSLEPDNDNIARKLEWAIKMRKTNQPTVPSTIGTEKEINPFMRVSEGVLQSLSKSNDPIATMGFIRKSKNNFAFKQSNM